MANPKNSLKGRLLMKAAEQAIDMGLRKMEETKNRKPTNAAPSNATPAEEPWNPIVSGLEGFLNKAFAEKEGKEAPVTTQKATAPEEARETPTRAALGRLSTIAGSLEEADTHRMVADIMLLVREGKNVPEDEKAEWVSFLYGRTE